MTDAPITRPCPTPVTSERPTMPRRRALLLVVAALVTGSLLSGAGAVWANHQFSDVPDGNPFHADIDWMVDNGIAEGYADGTYRPTNPVSRQAFAAFLHRYNDGLTVVTEQLLPTANTSWAMTIDCPTGKRVFGGGARNVVDTVVLGASYPLDSNTWRVTFVSRTGASIDPGVFDIYAYCVPA